MKKGEIIDRVVELVQDKSGAMRILVGGWVNIVLDDIASRGYLEALKREHTTNLVAGQRNYEIPAGTDKVYKCFVPAWGEPGKLKKRTDDEFLRDMLADGADYQSRPERYNIFANKTLRLHPIPSSDWAPVAPIQNEKLHLWTHKDIEHLNEGDDIKEIKVKHTPTILWGAYHFGARFDSLGDVPDASRRYESGILQLYTDQANDLDAPKQCPYRDL